MNKKEYTGFCTQFWELRNPRSRHRHICVGWDPASWLVDGFFLAQMAGREKEKETLSCSFLEGTDAIREGSTCVIRSPSKGSTFKYHHIQIRCQHKSLGGKPTFSPQYRPSLKAQEGDRRQWSSVLKTGSNSRKFPKRNGNVALYSRSMQQTFFFVDSHKHLWDIPILEIDERKPFTCSFAILQ